MGWSVAMWAVDPTVPAKELAQWWREDRLDEESWGLLQIDYPDLLGALLTGQALMAGESSAEEADYLVGRFEAAQDALFGMNEVAGAGFGILPPARAAAVAEFLGAWTVAQLSQMHHAALAAAYGGAPGPEMLGGLEVQLEELLSFYRAAASKGAAVLKAPG